MQKEYNYISCFEIYGEETGTLYFTKPILNPTDDYKYYYAEGRKRTTAPLFRIYFQHKSYGYKMGEIGYGISFVNALQDRVEFVRQLTQARSVLADIHGDISCHTGEVLPP